MTIIRKLLRTDGTCTELHTALTMTELCKLIDARRVEYARMRHLGGNPLHFLVFDESAIRKDLPLNLQATELQAVECRTYHMHCQPGTLHKVRGNVVVQPAREFMAEGHRS